jgi:iron(III) transport system ATP-binding protein
VSHLAVTDVRRTFRGRPPVAALRGVTVEVEQGSLLAVLGPSGCGKTTLLRVIAGMERADEGTVQLGHRVLEGPGVHVAPEKRRIGLVPQEGALFPHLDVAGNVGFGLAGHSRHGRAERVAELLELVGLSGMERRRPHELSGGQQQRVALARALAPEPEAVLLDEPFSALDTGLRAAIRAEVASTLREAGTTAVLVTHDQVEAMTMSHTLAVMRAGTIIQAGHPAELYRRPIDAWTARFLGDAVLVPGRREGDQAVRSAFGDARLTAGFAHHASPDVTVFCRPEQLQPVGDDAVGCEAVVTDVRFLGPDAVVTLLVDGASYPARWSSALLPEVGDRTRVAVTGEVIAYDPEAALDE